MKNLIALIYILTSFQSRSQCYLKETPSWGTPLSTTGSTKLDNILISEVVTMEAYFKVKVNLYAYDDSNGPNALAIADYATILMGKTLMLDELAVTKDFNSIIAIMAHEFGHIIQSKYKLNSSGTWVGKYPELHADYMAGWYIGKMKYLTDAQVNSIGDSFFNKGDKNFFSSSHHGSRLERGCAFMKGFYNSSTSLENAYNQGASFVANIEQELKKDFEAINQSKETTKSQPKVNSTITSLGKLDVTLGGKYKKAIIEVCINCKLPSMSQIMSGNTSNSLNGTKVEIGKLNRRKKVINLSKDLPPGKHVLCIKQIGPGYSEAFSEIEITSGQTIYKNASD